MHEPRHVPGPLPEHWVEERCEERGVDLGKGGCVQLDQLGHDLEDVGGEVLDVLLQRLVRVRGRVRGWGWG